MPRVRREPGTMRFELAVLFGFTAGSGFFESALAGCVAGLRETGAGVFETGVG